MSDLDKIDLAFTSLASDLAHAPAPGAAAAISTARRQRRTRVGAVALVAVAALGGGMTLPGLASSRDGVAADGGSSRLDAAALDDATQGWLQGWSLDTRMGGGFVRPGCLALDQTPGSTQQGDTVIFLDDSSATVRLAGFPDVTALDESWDRKVAAIAGCDGLGAPEQVPVDGTTVLHWEVALPDDGARTTDVWLARDGRTVGQIELVTPSTTAPAGSVQRVAQALVAGIRDGWTESGMRQVDPRVRGPLPEWTDVDLEGAFDGWRSPTKRAATTSPNLLCLHDRLDRSTAGTAAGGSPWGLSYRVAGYLDPADAQENVDRVLDELRACTSAEVELQTLPGGVHLATYDTGGPEPFNALWIVAEGDRAGMVALERADRPVPEGVPDDVAGALLEILRKPWQ